MNEWNVNNSGNVNNNNPNNSNRLLPDWNPARNKIQTVSLLLVTGVARSLYSWAKPEQYRADAVSVNRHGYYSEERGKDNG